MAECEKIVLIPVGVFVCRFPLRILPAIYKIIIRPQTGGDTLATVVLTVPHAIFRHPTTGVGL